MSLILRNLFAPPVVPPIRTAFYNTLRRGAFSSYCAALKPVYFAARRRLLYQIWAEQWSRRFTIVRCSSSELRRMCPIFVQEISCSKSEVFIIEITKGCFRRFVATFWSTFVINVRRARVKQCSYFVGGDLLEVNVGWDELRLVHRASGDGTCFPILVEVCELFLSMQSFNNIWRLN